MSEEYSEKRVSENTAYWPKTHFFIPTREEKEYVNLLIDRDAKESELEGDVAAF